MIANQEQYAPRANISVKQLSAAPVYADARVDTVAAAWQFRLVTCDAGLDDSDTVVQWSSGVQGNMQAYVCKRDFINKNMP